MSRANHRAWDGSEWCHGGADWLKEETEGADRGTGCGVWELHEPTSLAESSPLVLTRLSQSRWPSCKMPLHLHVELTHTWITCRLDSRWSSCKLSREDKDKKREKSRGVSCVEVKKHPKVFVLVEKLRGKFVWSLSEAIMQGNGGVYAVRSRRKPVQKMWV